jgi:hypothetical protein
MVSVAPQKITVDSVWCMQHRITVTLLGVCGTPKNQSDSIWCLWNPKELRVTLYGVWNPKELEWLCMVSVEPQRIRLALYGVCGTPKN